MHAQVICVWSEFMLKRVHVTCSFNHKLQTYRVTKHNSLFKKYAISLCVAQYFSIENDNHLVIILGHLTGIFFAEITIFDFYHSVLLQIWME